MNTLNYIIKWSNHFNAPIGEKDTVPSKDRVELSFKLVIEELSELVKAVTHHKDLSTKEAQIEILDAIGDSLWVLYRLRLEYGLNAHQIEHPKLYRAIVKNSDIKNYFELFSSYLLFTVVKLKESSNSNVSVVNSFTIHLIYDLNLFLYRFFDVRETDLIKVIYDSNMSKLCDTVDQAHESIDWNFEMGHATPDNIAEYEKIGTKYRILRADGKILKNKYFKEPDFSNLLDNVKIKP